MGGKNYLAKEMVNWSMCESVRVGLPSDSGEVWGKSCCLLSSHEIAEEKEKITTRQWCHTHKTPTIYLFMQSLLEFGGKRGMILFDMNLHEFLDSRNQPRIEILEGSLEPLVDHITHPQLNLSGCSFPLFHIGIGILWLRYHVSKRTGRVKTTSTTINNNQQQLTSQIASAIGPMR